jgi:CRP-like cAMP-binding protein
VELAATGSRAILASLGAGDICGDIAFLESGRATATVVAKDDEVEADEINSRELREVFEAFPRLASRFYLSLAVILAQRLKDTSRELAREMSLRDRRG